MSYQPPYGQPPYLQPPYGPPPAFYQPVRYRRPPRPPFDYGALIKDSFRLVWRHKFLWFFGLFSGGSATFQFNYSYSGGGDDGAEAGDFPTSVSDWITDHLALVIALISAAVLLIILLWMWSVICRGATIGGAEDIAEGRPSGFGAAFRRGKRSFVKILLLDLLLLGITLGIVFIIAAFVVLLVFLAASGTAGEVITGVIVGLLAAVAAAALISTLGFLSCIGLWFALFVPLNLVLMYATRAIVIDRLGPVAAIKYGWKLMVATLARTLILFLMNVGLSTAAGIGAALGILLTAVPAIAVWIVTGLNDWPTGGIIAASLLSIIPVAAAIVVAAAVNTYFTTFWTYIYLRLTGRALPAPQTSPAAF